MKTSILGVFGILANGMLQAVPVFTVTLLSGVTNTLYQAIGNGYVAASEGSATLANLYTACDLRVEGAGRLDVANDIKSNGFTGEVHVVQGSVLRGRRRALFAPTCRWRRRPRTVVRGGEDDFVIPDDQIADRITAENRPCRICYLALLDKDIAVERDVEYRRRRA